MPAVPSPKESVEVGKYFLGIPERWMDDPTWRCSNGHVTKVYLKTDLGDRCLECGASVRLTFPEDR